MVQIYLDETTMTLLNKAKLESPGFNLSQYVQRCIKDLDVQDRQLSEIEMSLTEALAKKQITDSLVLYWQNKKKEYDNNKFLFETEHANRKQQENKDKFQKHVDYILLGSPKSGSEPIASNLSQEQAEKLVSDYFLVPVAIRKSFKQWVLDEIKKRGLLE